MGFSGRKQGLETEKEASGLQETSSSQEMVGRSLFRQIVLNCHSGAHSWSPKQSGKSQHAAHPRAECRRTAHASEAGAAPLWILNFILEDVLPPVAAFSCFGLRVSSSKFALEACIVLEGGRREVGVKVLR